MIKKHRIADYRQDEGLRIRKELISPTLTAHSGGGLPHEVLLIESKERNETRLHRSQSGGVMDLAFPDSEYRRGRVINNGQTTNTLDTGCNIGLNVDDVRIRKLTPKECFRLQGFPDEYFDRAAEVCSDSQLYKQAGNSVTVNVIYEIAKRLEV